MGNQRRWGILKVKSRWNLKDEDGINFSLFPEYNFGADVEIIWGKMIKGVDIFFRFYGWSFIGRFAVLLI